MLVALTAIPVAIGVAVMRYRLYEIDRLINRTLVYAALTPALAATFAAVSLGARAWRSAPGSTLPTAAATLAVALLFGPLRSRVQLLVDRRFDRARYEGLRRVERYLEDLRAGRAAPEATGERDRRGDRRSEPRAVLLAPRRGGSTSTHRARVAELPAAGSGAYAGAPRRRSSSRRWSTTGARQRPDLLESVIGAAGLAIEIARLRVEVRRRLAEVEESRARIVTAGYEERRRLERDLHDGAQQRLVSIGLGAAPRAGPAARAEPAKRRSSTRPSPSSRDAIDELRELARGVRPAGLDDGLATALRELASRSPLRTRVEATDERFEDRLETAAYFVASEALTNAAKHADASSGQVSARGGTARSSSASATTASAAPSPSPGSGLAGMTDRVAALGGSLTVDSPAGRGHRGDGGAAVRVVIAEDQALLREGLGRLFEDAGHEVAAAVATPTACAPRSASTSPTSRWSTSACRRRSRTRASAPPRGSATPTRGRRAGALAAHRVGRGRRAGLPGRLRLPAQGPRARRRRVPRGGRARRQRRLGARPAGRGVAGRAARPTRSTR